MWTYSAKRDRSSVFCARLTPVDNCFGDAEPHSYSMKKSGTNPFQETLHDLNSHAQVESFFHFRSVNRALVYLCACTTHTLHSWSCLITKCDCFKLSVCLHHQKTRLFICSSSQRTSSLVQVYYLEFLAHNRPFSSIVFDCPSSMFNLTKQTSIS